MRNYQQARSFLRASWLRHTKSSIFTLPPHACPVPHVPSDAPSLARSDLAWYHFRCSDLPISRAISAAHVSAHLRKEDQHHAVATEEEFADEAVAVDGLALLSIRVPGSLAPHFLHVLQDHVAVAIEGFDACEQFAIVAGGNEDLGVVAHGGLEEGERARGEFVGFEDADFVFAGRICEWGLMVYPDAICDVRELVSGLAQEFPVRLLATSAERMSARF
jgi:hypothetical protein